MSTELKHKEKYGYMQSVFMEYSEQSIEERLMDVRDVFARTQDGDNRPLPFAVVIGVCGGKVENMFEVTGWVNWMMEAFIFQKESEMNEWLREYGEDRVMLVERPKGIFHTL